MRVSRAQVSASEQPILQQIQAERAANLSKARQQMGFAKAAAALLQGVAPRVQDTYTNAANADAGYAHGLGSDVQQTINQQADSNNAFLQKMGTPAAGLQHPADVGGTAYGLEGYIPATTLQREGAAFGSAAQMLPGDVLKQGQQQASATLSSDPNLTSLQGELAKIAATQPEVYQRLLSTLSTMGYHKAELGLSAQRLASENQYHQAELGQSQQRINISAQRAAQSAYSQNRNYRIALARLGLAKKSLQMRALKSEAKKNGAGGGFTPDELVHIRGQAGNIAQHAHDGIPASGSKAALPPLNYKQAFKQEILAGIPPSIAIQALREAGYNIPEQIPPLDIQSKQIEGAIFSGPGNARSARTPQGARNVAFRMAAGYGWGDANQLRALDAIGNRESGWNYLARNKKSGALGVGQELGHKVPKGYANNPLVQIKWMLDYIKQRYGSPMAAWQHEQQFGWY